MVDFPAGVVPVGKVTIKDDEDIVDESKYPVALKKAYLPIRQPIRTKKTHLPARRKIDCGKKEYNELMHNTNSNEIQTKGKPRRMVE
ncbi:hypothetical protein KIN20_014411 [Parelaphostrongylus tenuis]|uniref:Uncharacterized protein n=1 Tax=Parelaphostrongylus tenuis TaxID=148309 RepID=A0AAD5MDL2_PARTN|nr:hypothetical protein KIN20_014411 [Parelaphostrongylus tenuis]